MHNLLDLPKRVHDLLLTNQVLENAQVLLYEKNASEGLFASNKKISTPIVNPFRILWATDNYATLGEKYFPKEELHDTSVIVPRSLKTKDEQKRRSREKAEVFTPSWICNRQNNLVDSTLIGENAFNVESFDGKSWTATERVVFPKDYSWAKYVLEPVLEITCGEAPYLVSPYDTVTGDTIPLRDEGGNLQRIGLLDRKLRVVTENVQAHEWDRAALLALKFVYGYEWQGDNLVLARLNLLNTFIDYRTDAVGETPDEELLLKVAEVLSYNLFQMDGLKMVVPMSCSSKCKACEKKSYTGHDGLKIAVKDTVFELLLKQKG